MKKMILFTILACILLLCGCKKNNIDYNLEFDVSPIYSISVANEDKINPLKPHEPSPSLVFSESKTDKIGCRVYIIYDYEKHPNYDKWVEENHDYIYYNQTNPKDRIEYLVKRFIFESEIIGHVYGSCLSLTISSISPNVVTYSSLSDFMKDYDFYQEYSKNIYVEKLNISI